MRPRLPRRHRASGPGGENDPTCKREPVPGVFFPGAQCEWTAPPVDDPFPLHKNVLATPMVASFYAQGEFTVPSIVFTSYNGEDGGHESCVGDVPAFFGVIRIIDGRTCAQQATLAPPQGVIASTSVAIADLGGVDGTPEIVAVRQQGGLIAFTLGPTGWETLWETTSTFGDALCNWSGPSIHDLDDDGKPEVLFYGAVYDGATGATIDESLGDLGTDGISTGYLPVAADLDGDGNAELVTGKQIYTWDRTNRRWALGHALSPTSNGHTAIADFGTFPEAGADDRGVLDGVPEVVIIHAGASHIYNVFGRELFVAPLVAIGDPRIGKGGPPTIADFDGDGRVEFASAGASAYVVFDPDCRGTPDPATCSTMRTDGILWAQASQDFSSNTTGSSVFDFDGDDRAEVVYGDECFTRVYDGLSGKVVYSRYRTSCTWYENPVIADVDADFNAEIVSTSNTNCNVVCPAVDPIFDGVQCLDDSDCPSTAPCRREALADPLGRCRCELDDDCGGDGFVCLDPLAGPSTAGKVCRASHPAAAAASGIRVLADGIDRWINTRQIWNQHAYAVTNIGEDGKVPRTSLLDQAGPQQLPGEHAGGWADRRCDPRSHDQVDLGHVRSGWAHDHCRGVQPRHRAGRAGPADRGVREGPARRAALHDDDGHPAVSDRVRDGELHVVRRGGPGERRGRRSRDRRGDRARVPRGQQRGRHRRHLPVVQIAENAKARRGGLSRAS
ncbi:MAG: VCBS repeat-containing protein [Proteobacteria bacterium]|nr:VCBS repeat-containing protein [Pseudomonadota bacterium]